MKQKMIIGALAFASIFAFAQRAGEGTGDSSETERRFWGNQIVGVASCVPTTPFPDGSPRFIKTWIVEYYVLWIGVSTTQSEPIESSHCGMP
jgi:hypothetical protein